MEECDKRKCHISSKLHMIYISSNNGKSKGKGHPATGRVGPRGFGWFKAPDFLHVRHYKDGRSSAISTGRLYPRGNPCYSLSEAELTSEHMVPSRGTTKKNPQ